VNPVFLDTVGLIALWDEDDQWHDAASRAFEQVKGTRAPVVTTSYIDLQDVFTNDRHFRVAGFHALF
jgi:hypothetical protein